ncbi:MAG: tetratricopeptide repeat protein [Chromatiales bacterium]|nr:tetratricopeptide repeat protein [Chromatiales bacterium]
MSKVRPNDPCPCGSGKKYKKCCGAAGTSGLVDPQAVLRAAFTHLQQGRQAEAIRKTQNLLNAGHRHPDVYGILASALLQQGCYREAEGALMAILRIVPDSAEIWANLGLVQLQAGEYQSAMNSCGRALELDPNHPPAYKYIGDVFQKLGNYPEAEKNYRKVLELLSNDLAARANLGKVLYKQHKYEEAISELEAVLAKAPKAAVAHSALGMVYMAKGREKLALASLERAIQLEPGEADHFINLGFYWQHQENREKADAAFKKALKIAPHNAEVYLHLAELHEKDNDLSGKYFAMALHADPDNPIALVRVGIGMLKAGKYERGKEMLDKALHIDSDLGIAYAGLALGAILQHREARADKHMKRALELAPDDSYVNGIYVQLLQLQRRDEEAIVVLLRLLETDPYNTHFWLELARAYDNACYYDKAEQAFRRATELLPNAARPYLAWADFEEKRHNLDLAHTLAQKAERKARNEDDRAYIYRMLARIARRNGRLEEALEYIEHAVKAAIRLNVLTVRAAIEFEKGELLDKLKHYPEAYASFEAANQLTARSVGEHFDDAADWAAHQIELLSDGRFQALSPCEKEGCAPQPIFVVGFPRSGTTLMEQILGAHGQVLPAGELTFMGDIAHHSGRELSGVNASYPEWLLQLPTEQSSEVLASLRDRYLAIARGTLGEVAADWFVDKMPLNQNLLGLVYLLFPESPIIHMVRHPLDSCLSAFMASFNQGNAYSNRMDTTARFYARSSKLTLWYRDHLPLRYKAVRYEELVADQERMTREVLDFVGLPWDDACLSFHESKRVARTASYAQVTQKIYTSSRYRYKNYYEQLKPVFPIIEDTVKAYGYEIEPSDRKEVASRN